MDLPSMARVTKLPRELLQSLSVTTPIFAPGVDAMSQVGAIAAMWEPLQPLDAQLESALASITPLDERDVRGAQRGGRKLAADVARRVVAEAIGHGDATA